MKQPISKKKLFLLIFGLGFVLLFLGVGTFYTVRYFLLAQQSCFTREEVTADSRCLYILEDKVFEKGSRDLPHQGNPCGTDITAILPASHRGSPVLYLDPNLKGTVCSSTPPTATPMPTATPAPTDTPVPTPTPLPPTPTPTALPTNTPMPTSPLAATATPPSTQSTSTVQQSTRTPTPTQIIIAIGGSSVKATTTPTPTVIPTKSILVEAQETSLAPISKTSIPTISILPVTATSGWIFFLIPVGLVMVGLLF